MFSHLFLYPQALLVDGAADKTSPNSLQEEFKVKGATAAAASPMYLDDKAGKADSIYESPPNHPSASAKEKLLAQQGLLGGGANAISTPSESDYGRAGPSSSIYSRLGKNQGSCTRINVV